MPSRPLPAPTGEFAATFQQFRRILALNNAVLEKIGRMESALAGEYVFDRKFLAEIAGETGEVVREVVYCLNRLTGDAHLALYDVYGEIGDKLAALASGEAGPYDCAAVLPYTMLNSDFEELVGSKNATLCEIRNRLQLPVPDGFAITVAAYQQFMAENDLFVRIDAMAAGDLSTAEQAARIEVLFTTARLPESLTAAVTEELQRLRTRCGGRFALAVRSSGIGEDGETRSFAGQFRSVLAVAPEPSAVLAAYRQVIASRFSVAALAYLGPGAGSRAVPMAVAVQPLIAGHTAGVTYSRNPMDPERPELLITAVHGAGRELVAGRKSADRFTVSRIWPFSLLESEVAAEAAAGNDPLALLPNGLRRGSATLTPDALAKLAAQAVLLEKAFGEPQDIEWTMTGDEPVILQSRPFTLPAKPPPPPAEIAAELAAAQPLMAGKGQVAQLGIAAGRVVMVDQDTVAERFPVGAIAVARFPSPRLSPIVWRAAAIITDIGGPTGHLATIAREYRTPALFGTGEATKVLATGEEVTVDVENKMVYRGVIDGLVRLQAAEKDSYRASPELRTLRRMLRWVAPITLNEPASPAFRPEKCRTYHDILRFCHEKAVDALIHVHGGPASQQEGGSRPVRLPVPLKLRVIDLGSGLAAGAPPEGELTLAMLASRPLAALFAGFLRGVASDNGPAALDFRDLLTSLGRPLSMLTNWPAYAGDNLAIIADDYCNLSLRLGYHFNVVDVYMSPEPDNNYIYFRFVGGMASEEKRERRARLIGAILAGLYFKVERHGDLVVAKARNLDSGQMERVLTRLGELISFTRQLDVRMRDEGAIEQFFAHFLAAVRADQAGASG